MSETELISKVGKEIEEPDVDISQLLQKADVKYYSDLINIFRSSELTPEQRRDQFALIDQDSSHRIGLQATDINALYGDQLLKPVIKENYKMVKELPIFCSSLIKIGLVSENEIYFTGGDELKICKNGEVKDLAHINSGIGAYGIGVLPDGRAYYCTSHDLGFIGERSKDGFIAKPFVKEKNVSSIIYIGQNNFLLSRGIGQVKTEIYNSDADGITKLEDLSETIGLGMAAVLPSLDIVGITKSRGKLYYFHREDNFWKSEKMTEVDTDIFEATGIVTSIDGRIIAKGGSLVSEYVRNENGKWEEIILWSSSQVNSVKLVSDSLMWVGSYNGEVQLVDYSSKPGKLVTEFNAGGIVRDLFPLSEGRVMVNVEGSNLQIFDGDLKDES